RRTIGLKLDGTVMAVGRNKEGECNVSSWRNIVATAAGDWHTVGLKVGGTVMGVGNNRYGQCDVSSWRDIVAVAA
ncbi:chromosome condensation regulator, partial [Bacillus anthracis]